MKYVFASLLEPEKNIELWYCDEPCCRAEQLHRQDGPAVSHPDGTAEWWWHGKRVTEAELRAMRGRLAAEVMRRGHAGPVIAPARAQFRPRTDRRVSRDVFASVLEVGKSIELWYCDAPCCQGQRLHRDGGPAVTYPSGVEEWWFHGELAPAEQVRFREGERAAAAMCQPLSEPVAVFKQPIRIKTRSADEREPGEG